MIRRCAPLVVALAAAGCTAGTDGPGAVGYVLLDHDARAVGRLTQDDWQGAPLLPVALDVTEPVAFSSPAGRTVFDVRPGMLAHVHGPAGALEWLRLGEDVSEDRMRVYASKEAATDLARHVAGRVEGGGDGLWTIVAPEILDRMSFLEPPEGVTEVVPERTLGAGARSLGAPIELRSNLGPVTALPDGESEGVRQAVIVGVYASGQSALFLDASGGFSLEDACSGDVVGQGRYRTDGDRVVLDSESAPMVLAFENGELRDANGARFAPLVESAVTYTRGEP